MDETSNLPSSSASQRRKYSDEQLKEWLDACDPARPLDPSSDKYCDLGWAVQGDQRIELRGDDHIELMLDTILLKSNESCQLFSGFSGTGKSTELRRLKHKLEEEGYVVLLADARDYHDLSHALTIEDLTILIAGSLGEAVSKLLDRDVAHESYWQKLRDFLKSEVDVTVKIPAGLADLKIGMKHNRPFWTEVRDALGLAPAKLKENAHTYIRSAVEEVRVRRKTAKGVVFILDSLEKLSAPMPDFQQVMSSLVRVLTDFPAHFHLPGCHAIYTIPPYVSLISPHLGDFYRVSEILPAVKVVERFEGARLKPYRPGIDKLTELVQLRIDVEKVFGDHRDLLEKLIMDSGGHVRMLLRFLTELLIQARSRGLPPSEEEIVRVETPVRQRLENSIQRGAAPLLRSILEHGSLSGLETEEHAQLAQLMEVQAVLSYRNGETWFELNPLVHDTARRLAEGSDS